MDFANPWYLAALPLALTPVIIHLFFHRRKSMVDFSSLLFFEKRKHYFAFRKNLLEILLLACRVLILALIIFALARPRFKKFSFLKGAGVESVIILDDTMSMQRPLPGGRTAFELAKSQAESLMNTLSGDDGAGLILLSGKNGVPLSRKKDHVLKAIREASVTGASGSISAAIALASDQLARAPGVNREIYLISDFQKSAAPARKAAEGLKNCRLFLIKAGIPTMNFSISDVWLPASGIVPGNTVRIPFTLHNYADKDRETRVSLEIAGRLLQSKTVSVPANKSVRESFPFVPTAPGVIEGAVLVQDQSISLDDRIPFVFSVTEVTKIALFSDSAQMDPWFYLRPAIDPRPDSMPLYGFRTVRFSAADMISLDSKKTAAVYLPPTISLNPANVSALIRYVRGGGTLFLFPESGGSDRFYRDFAHYSDGQIPVLYSKTVKPSVSGLRFEKPFTDLNDTLQLDLLRWRHLIPPKTETSIVLARAGTVPVIVQRPLGRGRMIIFGFDLRRRDSNWPELKSFPVAMLRLLKNCSSGSEKQLYADCGIAIETDAESATDSFGKTVRITQNKYQTPWLPVIVKFNGGSVDFLSAAPPERESDPEQMDDRAIRQCFAVKVTLLNAEESPDQQVVRLRKGTELTGPALMAALMLAALEFLLGAKPPVFRIREEETAE